MKTSQTYFRNEIYGPIALINIDGYLLYKRLANIIYTYVKRITYHNQAKFILKM